MQKFLTSFVFIFLLSIFASGANASLLGQQVAGGLYFGGGGANYFDPVNGYVPGTALNSAGSTVTIADPAVEFGFIDGSNEDMANFSSAGFVITDNVLRGASDWEMIFTSAGFIGLTLLETSDNFVNGGLTANLVGDTITLNWAGIQSAAGLLTAEYSLTAVPLPAALPLYGAGLVAMGFIGWRRKRKAAA